MKSRLLAITLAVVLAVVGIVAVLAYVRQANARAVNGLRAESVLVAAANIPAGTSLSTAKAGRDLTTEMVPDSSVTNPVKSVTATNENYVVSGPVAKGQVLLENMLATSTSDTAGGFVIPKGLIAISIDVCVPEAVADYVTAGSNIDVFDTVMSNAVATQETPSCNPEHSVLGTGDLANGLIGTGLVLTDISVLAVGQNPVSQSTSAGSSTTVTTQPVSSSSSSTSETLLVVAVTESEAQTLITMGQIGIPYLALLGPGSPSLTPNSQLQNLFQAQP